MEISIIKEEKDLLELGIKGEGHTLCNVLRDELWTIEDTSFVSYRMGHPLSGSPVLALKVKKGEPRQAFVLCVQSLKEKTKELRALLVKLN